MQVTNNTLGPRPLDLHTPLAAPQCGLVGVLLNVLAGVLLDVLSLLIADPGAVAAQNLSGPEPHPGPASSLLGRDEERRSVHLVMLEVVSVTPGTDGVVISGVVFLQLLLETNGRIDTKRNVSNI